MDGFLNRLAARALGLAPVAEPIIPARFTPDTRLTSPFVNDPLQAPGQRPISTRPDPTPFHPAAQSHTPSPTPYEEQPSEPRARSAEVDGHPALHLSSIRPMQPDTHSYAHPSMTPRFDTRDTNPVDPVPPPRELSPASDFPVIARDSQPVNEFGSSPGTAGNPRSAPLLSTPPAPRPSVDQPSLNIAAPRADTPTVRISIRRVEVHAELPPPKPSPLPLLSKPSHVTLQQFLDGQRGAGS